MHFFKEKKSGKLRPLVDYQWLNLFLNRPNYSTPPIEELLASIDRSSIFSVVDVENGFANLKLSEESSIPGVSSKELCAASFVRGEVLIPERMTQGISVAPSFFQRIMEEVLSGTFEGVDIITDPNDSIQQMDLRPHVPLYVDDMLIHASDIKEHDKILKELLRRLSITGFKVNPDKCVFARRQVTFLGFNVSEGSTKASESNLRKIRGMPDPKNLKMARSFLAFCSYFRTLIPNFATIAKPIQENIKQKKFIWTTEHQDAKKELLEAIVETCRTHVDYDKIANGSQRLIVCTDASAYAIGGTLMVEENNQRKLVLAHSRKLKPSEINYSATDQEFLAVVDMLQKCRYYVSEVPFTVETDHKALISILSSQRSNAAPLKARDIRWKHKISDLPYTIKHISGTSNVLADYMSRYIETTDVNNMDSHPEEEKINRTIDIISHKASIKQQQKDNKELQEFLKWTKSKHKNPDPCQDNPYFKHRHAIHEKNGTAYYNNAVIITSNPAQEELFELIHTMTLPHVSPRKCIHYLKQVVWFPRMLERISVWASQCQLCIERNRKFEKAFPDITIPASRFDTLQMDCIQLPSTSTYTNAVDGYFCLVVIDVVTRFVWICPLGQKSAENVAKALVSRVFPQYGFPRVIRSDEGA